MKRMTSISMVIVLLGAILLLDGCEGLTRNRQGSPVTFTTTTGEVGTKTYYGDNYLESGTTTWQYIVWEVGDVIQIVSDKATTAAGVHYANYTIDAVTGNADHQSYATIVPTPNGLDWGEDQIYDFYAVTPAPGTGAVNKIHGPDTENYNPTMIGTTNCTLPAAPTLPTNTSSKTVTSDGKAYTYTVYPPDMNYAVMTAANEDFNNTTKEDVSLLFKPAFTAFEINLTSADEDFTVTKLELANAKDGEYLAGTYVFTAGSDISVEGSVLATGTGNSKSVSMTMNQVLTASTGVTVTFFTMPIKNTGMISLKVETDKGTATLNLTGTDKISAYQFEPGKKYRFNMLKVGETWKIFFDVAVDDWIEVTPATTVII